MSSTLSPRVKCTDSITHWKFESMYTHRKLALNTVPIQCCWVTRSDSVIPLLQCDSRLSEDSLTEMCFNSDDNFNFDDKDCYIPFTLSSGNLHP